MRAREVLRHNEEVLPRAPEALPHCFRGGGRTASHLSFRVQSERVQEQPDMRLEEQQERDVERVRKRS